MHGEVTMNTTPPDLDRITAEYLEGLLSAGGPPSRLFTVGYGRESVIVMGQATPAWPDFRDFACRFCPRF